VKSDDAIRIGAASPDERRAALGLVFGQLSEENRDLQIREILSAASADESLLDGLFVARREGAILGAAFAQVQPGRAASAWLPRLDPMTPFDRTLSERLFSAACEWLARQDIHIAQILVENASDVERAIMIRQGFLDLGSLLYLVSPKDTFPASVPIAPLSFETYNPANHERLARMVEATYRDTKDYPELNGARRIDDILTGYKSAGEFDAARWLLARHDDRDVGCLLLADYPPQGNMELVYMGVAAGERGHGWGLHLARRAQWLARLAGRERLVLAVDLKNSPAIAIYAEAGFQAWDRRSVFVKYFSRI
jgi:mycothiol synthase